MTDNKTAYRTYATEPNAQHVPLGVIYNGRHWLYKDWLIHFDYPPIPIRDFDFGFCHKDYDGPGDNRCGNAKSIEACVAEIDDMELEMTEININIEEMRISATEVDWENDRNAHLKETVAPKPVEQWMIFSNGVQGFNFGKVVSDQDNYFDVKNETEWFNVPKAFPNSNIVAYHPTKEACKAALARAQALEKLLRPMWQAAIEHEKRVKQIMIEAVWAEAKT